MEMWGVAGVASISVITYLMAELVKALTLDGKWIPVICGILGAILGIAAMYTVPQFPAGDPISAVAVGIVSGLAATGSHEIYKQLGGERK